MKCDFSLAHYKEILETALAAGYSFLSYDDDLEEHRGKRICILRHDIDYTPERAVFFGEIEADLGIRSTYFFQICAGPYNIRERRNHQVIRRLNDWGHHLSLHLDLGWNPDSSWAEVVDQVKKEKQIFQLMTGVTPGETVSVHNPHRYADRVMNQVVEGMPHTYEPKYFSEIKYFSDSQGWYEGCMCAIFREKKYPHIQFLTHPYIWPKEDKGGFIANMAELIKDRSVELESYLVKYHPVCKKEEKTLRSLLQGSAR
jgi:hypothetical protein